MPQHPAQNEDYLYRQVVDLISDQIRHGTLGPGERLPSLRQLSTSLGVSVPTVRQGYLELERQDFIEARPKSGYYVMARRRNPPLRMARNHRRPAEVCCQRVIDEVYAGMHQPGVLPLGIANPSMAMPATGGLNRTMKRVMGRSAERALSYAPTNGEPALQRQIAHYYLAHGVSVDPGHVVITNGGQEALTLALSAVASPGDIIAVESPTYHGMLELIEGLGMRALEIETCPRMGVDLDALEAALDEQPVAACAFSSALNNPLGCLTSSAHRSRLVELLEAREVPLVEDDVYGDLAFDLSRQEPAQAMTRSGRVLTVGSFSKTLAPGYRIGWLLPGAWLTRVQTLKRALSCSSGMLQQLTIAEFMASGDFDRHIRRLVPTLKHNAERMMARVARCFPAETRVSEPAGGTVLWLQLPDRMDANQVFREALEAGISTLPGSVAAAGNRYRDHIRLSYGHPWSEAMEQGIDRLGRIIGGRHP